jgi:hypothetical protein
MNGFPAFTNERKGGGAMFWWRFWWLVMVAWCLHFCVITGSQYVEQQLNGLIPSENYTTQSYIA